MSFLLELNPAISFTVLCLITVSLSLLGLYLTRRKYPHELVKENHEVAAIIFNAFGLLYAVVCGFVVIVTWQGYDDANKNLQMEANEVGVLYNDSRGFPDSLRTEIQASLVEYANVVMKDEMITMAKGEESPAAITSIRKLWGQYMSINPTNPKYERAYNVSVDKLNALAEYRRLRIFAGNNTVPNVIWMAILIGAFITIIYTYFFGMKSRSAQYVITSALAIMLTIIILLIYILDHPFTGANAISADPFKQVLNTMTMK